ncbi:MAG: JAB domain-containing protein [Bacteroidales bacterium]|nr:JAB domain-containing protein [Bacteroidales bacterium]
MEQQRDYTQQANTKAPEIEIYYKTSVKTDKRPKISSPSDVFTIVSQLGEMSRNMEYKELFYAIYTNVVHDVLAVHKISEGTTKNALVDIKFIMQGAIMTNAENLILCHNHPSGSTRPSTEDRKITEKIKNAAALFDVRVTDSVIISTDNYFSFLEEGII